MVYDAAFARRFLAMARGLGPTFTAEDLARRGVHVRTEAFVAFLESLYQDGLIAGAGVSHNLGISETASGRVLRPIRLRLTLRGRTLPLPELALSALDMGDDVVSGGPLYTAAEPPPAARERTTAPLEDPTRVARSVSRPDTAPQLARRDSTQSP